MRERWIDSWKGLLIFLVVLGHVVGVLCHATTGEAGWLMAQTYRWIYLFHMPAFFMVAGVAMAYGARRSTGGGTTAGGNGFGRFLQRRVRRLVVPYFFWGAVSVVVFASMENVVRQLKIAPDLNADAMFAFPWWRPLLSLLHAGGWPSGEGFRWNSVLWFLPCMFMTSLAEWVGAACVRRIRGSKPSSPAGEWLGELAVFLGLLTLGGWVRFHCGGLPWGIDRVPRFWAFLRLGRMIGRRWLLAESAKRSAGVANFGNWGVGGLAVIVLTWGVGVFPDLRAAFFSWEWYFAEAGFAVVGSVMTLALARSADCQILARVGAMSLGIMVLHKFPILALQSVVPNVGQLGRLGLMATAVAVSAAVTAVGWGAAGLCRRFLPWTLGETRRQVVQSG